MRRPFGRTQPPSDLPDRVGQRGDLAQAAGHGLDPAWRRAAAGR